MKTVEDFKRAFKIKWFYVEPCYRVHIPGYETICFHELYESHGETYLVYSVYSYSWGGCNYYDNIFYVLGSDFSDDMTDEEMREKLIEIVKEKKPELVQKERIVYKVMDDIRNCYYNTYSEFDAEAISQRVLEEYHNRKGYENAQLTVSEDERTYRIWIEK